MLGDKSDPNLRCPRINRVMCAADRLTYTDVKERLNLSDEDVLRLLHSLSMAKYKILGKEPSNKVLAKTDTFFFNSKFTSPMRRIRVRSQKKLGWKPAMHLLPGSLGA